MTKHIIHKQARIPLPERNRGNDRDRCIIPREQHSSASRRACLRGCGRRWRGSKTRRRPCPQRSRRACLPEDLILDESGHGGGGIGSNRVETLRRAIGREP